MCRFHHKQIDCFDWCRSPHHATPRISPETSIFKDGQKQCECHTLVAGSRSALTSWRPITFEEFQFETLEWWMTPCKKSSLSYIAVQQHTVCGFYGLLQRIISYQSIWSNQNMNEHIRTLSSRISSCTKSKETKHTQIHFKKTKQNTFPKEQLGSAGYVVTPFLRSTSDSHVDHCGLSRLSLHPSTHLRPREVDLTDM